ncbi:ankyrin repeat-containing domain protein [Lasiosphaeris hirsuta]|uniref:Ankyrin repeat-containing domain protein n=1 Tax=Lasiosphaeris hirsuta TaxID=260670 RepID=A0AA40A2W5_9PEZI|nr:ankyrin repeat-containing domain protein [Lasiosphaeris hirsuta]
MFLLAQLHMDSLARKLTRREVRAALGSLPKELYDTYDQAMHRIHSQNGDQAALADRVLSWLSYPLRPLTVPELQHALAVEPGDNDLDEEGLYDAELLVSVCAGLVTLDEEGSRIRLVHYTTQEYFVYIRGDRFPEAPTEIAKTCLTYLAFSPFAVEYCSSKEKLKVRLEHYPFLSYAASYWGDHLSEEMDAGVRELAQEFLSNSISIISADQAAKDRFYYLHWITDGGAVVRSITRLHAIAAIGRVEFIKDLLAEGADVNVWMGTGSRPLHRAVEGGHVQMVRLLLQAGADVTATEGADRLTPLHVAASQGHASIAQLLLDAGADCDACGGYWKNTPLHLAADKGNVDVARALIERGANVNHRNITSHISRHRRPEEDADGKGGLIQEERGEAPLLLAAGRGDKAFALLLLDNGADVSAINDDNGYTALHCAVDEGHVGLMELLLERGINISAKTFSGNTALHHATKVGNLVIV